MPDEHRAYLTGLKLLARRELSEAQVRSRLSRRQFTAEEIDRAVGRLKDERAIDDRRTALACARTEVTVRRHGRARALRQLESLGIARDIAQSAVREVFAEIDEDALMTEVLDRRLRRQKVLDVAGLRRMHRYLIAHGFDPGRVTAVLSRYARTDP
jgi:regulatory protein